MAVAHRTRQLRSWLAGGLENFKIHQEGHVSRIPKQIRGMTMREFGEKYHGNVQAALRGVQREKLASVGNDPAFGEIDKNMRKRKWLASQDQETTADPSEPRALKNGAFRSPFSLQSLYLCLLFSSLGISTTKAWLIYWSWDSSTGASSIGGCKNAWQGALLLASSSVSDVSSSPRVDHCLVFRNLPVLRSQGLLSMLARVPPSNPSCLRLVNPNQTILLPVPGSLLYRRLTLPCHPRRLVIQGASRRIAMSYACLEGTKACSASMVHL